MKRFVPLATLFLLLACNSENSDSNKAQWKDEIHAVEAEFAEMALNQGVAEAFLHFADKEAVLLRNNRLIKGKEAIGQYFSERQTPKNVKLSWNTDFVQVSEAGDMAYTFGEYQFTMTDSTGIEQTTDGIFHTVWKRQEDGSWKYVWD